MKAPDGTAKKLPAGPTKTTVGPFDQVGVWAVVPTAAGGPVEEFAVNLMSRAESDLRTADPDATTASAEAAGLVGGFGGRPVWWYLTIAAFLLAALEWYLYQRRWIS